MILIASMAILSVCFDAVANVLFSPAYQEKVRRAIIDGRIDPEDWNGVS